MASCGKCDQKRWRIPSQMLLLAVILCIIRSLPRWRMWTVYNITHKAQLSLLQKWSTQKVHQASSITSWHSGNEILQTIICTGTYNRNRRRQEKQKQNQTAQSKKKNKKSRPTKLRIKTDDSTRPGLFTFCNRLQERLIRIMIRNPHWDLIIKQQQIKGKSYNKGVYLEERKQTHRDRRNATNST